jgi:hypothetical protein
MSLKNRRVARLDKRVSRPLGKPCHVDMVESVLDFISYEGLRIPSVSRLALLFGSHSLRPS